MRQLVLGTKGKTYTVLTERTSWKTATYFIIVSYAVGFYRNKGAGACWCLRKCRSSMSHLGIMVAWELRIYSRGSNCLHKGPEATSEGLAHRCLKGVQQPWGKEYIHLICISWDFAVLVLRMNTVLQPQTALNRPSILTLALWQWFQNIFHPSCLARTYIRDFVLPVSEEQLWRIGFGF